MVVVCTSRSKNSTQQSQLFTQFTVVSAVFTSQSDIFSQWEIVKKFDLVPCVAMVILLIDSSTQCLVVCEKLSSSMKLVNSLRRSSETTVSNGQSLKMFGKKCSRLDLP